MEIGTKAQTPKTERAMAYLLYIIAFLLPLQTRLIIKPGELNGGYFEYGTYSLYLSDLLLLSLFLLFLSVYFQKSINSKLWKNNINFGRTFSIIIFSVILFLCSALLSIFFAVDKLLAVYAFIRLLAGCGLLSVIIYGNYGRFKLISAFVAGAVMQSVIAIWQFLGQFGYASKWLGMALHDPSVLGTAVVESWAGRLLRAYGTLDHPNMLGATLAAALLLIIFTHINYPVFFGEKFFISNFQFPIKYAFLTAYFLLLTALFFTFSRSAWLALFAGLFACLPVSFNRIRRLPAKQVLFLCASGVFVLAVLAFYFRLELTARVEGLGRLEEKSIEERLDLNSRALELIKSNLWTGVGIGNFALAVHDELQNDQPPYYYQPVHNAFLLIFAEQGLLGIMAMAMLIIVIFSAFISETANFLWIAENGISPGISRGLALFIMLLIIMIFDHWFFSLHYGFIFFFFMLGVIIYDLKNGDAVLLNSG